MKSFPEKKYKDKPAGTLLKIKRDVLFTESSSKKRKHKDMSTASYGKGGKTQKKSKTAGGSGM